MANTPDTSSSKSIRQDPLIEKVLKRSPSNIAETFTDEQLNAIKMALGPNTWGGHFLDSRGTFKFPFIKWRFYYVFLLGKNKRAYTRREKNMSMLMMFATIGGFILMSTLFGLLLLYLLKSWLGIDLFPDTSLGIWDAVKSRFE
ncbi:MULTISPECIES: hypothetical protein [Shewanella]|uniref:hypothetical protein n=1 Tax=Shewanella TaxID=22 RepID=UPI0006D65584|nr:MULTISPECIES: hypothetical protein [Shewanella]KPZ67794.1 hypothetical protein AN944_03895 [Shewanella sp. P1-14-1]MBQ4889220.1 hypothetical protein [Shewanella sp. MMG014]